MNARVSELVPVEGGFRLHLLHVTPEGCAPDAPGVLALHGLFTHGAFFLNSKDEGPGRTLLDAGFRLHIADLRGHGKSEADDPKADWSLDAYVRQDIPALIRAISGGGPLFLLAHSMAGYAALAALGCDPSLQARLAGAVVLSAAVNDYTDGGLSKRIQIPLSAWVAGLLGHFPARALKMGPCDEPVGLMRQLASWAPNGDFRGADGTDYWAALGAVTLPVFALIGAGDVFHASPARARKLFDRLGSADRTFQICGKAEGFSKDFEHVDILRGQAAQAEVLPRVLAWMRSHGAHTAR